MPRRSRRNVIKAIGIAGGGAGLTYGVWRGISPSDDARDSQTFSKPTKTVDEYTERTTGTEATTETTATPTTTPQPTTWRLRPLAQSTLTSSVGGFSEGAIRADGQYAVVGTRFAGQGSYLVDLRDLRQPKTVHHLPTTDGETCLDTKFGPADGLYCRTNHPATTSDVEIVDYGFADGTPRSPSVIGRFNAGGSHNLFVRSDSNVIYTVNYEEDPAVGGIDVWDVSTPRSPRQLGTIGPPGAAHDIVYDPKREVLHCAYMGGEFDGYLLLDVSDPRSMSPTEIGRFDYDEYPSYDEVETGVEAFGNCHYALPDPHRDLVIVGDERSYGNPGGKHVFDIGWKDGSLENPIPVGFTVSPNAKRMQSDGNEDGDIDELQRFDWTGHQFDIISLDHATLLTSGDWHEGTVLYDITDPTSPAPIDTHKTNESPVKRPSKQLKALGDPPMAYSSAYNSEREYILTSDLFTGVYTYQIQDIV